VVSPDTAEPDGFATAGQALGPPNQLLIALPALPPSARAVPDDPGFRGRGLLMMSTCMAAMHIEHNASGTAVTLSSNPVPSRADT
jgi:hypothetical protein